MNCDRCIKHKRFTWAQSSIVPGQKNPLNIILSRHDMINRYAKPNSVHYPAFQIQGSDYLWAKSSIDALDFIFKFYFVFKTLHCCLYSLMSQLRNL